MGNWKRALAETVSARKAAGFSFRVKWTAARLCTVASGPDLLVRVQPEGINRSLVCRVAYVGMRGVVLKCRQV